MRSVFMILSALWPLTSPTDEPLVVGLAREQPLSERATGELLIGELGCASCHSGLPSRELMDKRAPDLSEVGARVSFDYLERYIADPRGAHPGTSMPDVLGGLAPQDREHAAVALASFLASLGSAPESDGPASEQERKDGDALFHTVGCVACHQPIESAFEGEAAPMTKGRDLAHVGQKYDIDGLADFLFDPLKTRPSGRMPDMLLTSGEARSIAGYLIGDTQESPASAKPRADLIDEGRALFESTGCVACHALDGLAAPAPRALDFSSLALSSLDRGCLAPNSAKAPDFGLSDAQRSAIRKALSTPNHERQARERVELTLTGLGCLTCHVRGDLGGISPELNAYFETTEHDLGEEARIPPPLTLVGAKLQPEALRGVLFDGQRVRPYMRTRMPRFASDDLEGLAELFIDLDEVEPYTIGKPERDASKIARDSGRELVGSDGLACISCHNFNGKESPSFRGMDMLTFAERLQPNWFAHFLISPQRFRPGIVMPESWSGGIASHQEILAGDTQAQIEAIWHYLTFGTSAATPKGIERVRTTIEVTDTTRVYRGRSSVAGFRGIAVGFPGGMNYAFNANTGTLSAIWQGDFVSARWDGQGAGDFQPMARAAQLAQDVSFYRLQSPDEPWPLKPVMTEEAPVNPDPLYPRNRGYRFAGYYMDEDSIPTFMYRSGDVEIEDRCHVERVDGRANLVRTFTFQAPAAQELSLRVLTGEIVTLPDGGFQNDQVRVATRKSGARVRSTSIDEAPQELLLKIDLPRGTSNLSLRYELLR